MSVLEAGLFDHITIGVLDFERSTKFYDEALKPLGVGRVYDVPPKESGWVRVTGYGVELPVFWLAEEKATRGLLHIAFGAKNRSEVDAFHAAALSAGGIDNGAPGLRPHYHPDYYAAFIFDPDGHNIEAVCHTPLG